MGLESLKKKLFFENSFTFRKNSRPVETVLEKGHFEEERGAWRS